MRFETWLACNEMFLVSRFSFVRGRATRRRHRSGDCRNLGRDVGLFLSRSMFGLDGKSVGRDVVFRSLDMRMAQNDMLLLDL